MGQNKADGAREKCRTEEERNTKKTRTIPGKDIAYADVHKAGVNETKSVTYVSSTGPYDDPGEKLSEPRNASHDVPRDPKTKYGRNTDTCFDKETGKNRADDAPRSYVRSPYTTIYVNTSVMEEERKETRSVAKEVRESIKRERYPQTLPLAPVDLIVDPKKRERNAPVGVSPTNMYKKATE